MSGVRVPPGEPDNNGLDRFCLTRFLFFSPFPVLPFPPFSKNGLLGKHGACRSYCSPQDNNLASLNIFKLLRPCVLPKFKLKQACCRLQRLMQDLTAGSRQDSRQFATICDIACVATTPIRNEEWTDCANWVIYRLLSLPMGRFPAHFFLHALALRVHRLATNGTIET